MHARPEKKKSDRDLGGGLKYSVEEDDSVESTRYNDVSLDLLMFADGLAAILSKEVPARANEVGKLIVTDAGGHPM